MIPFVWRVSTASSSDTLVLCVRQSDRKEVTVSDAVKGEFFRHLLLLIYSISLAWMGEFIPFMFSSKRKD